MSNTTKLALEASLKKLLQHKKIDKITINDLTTDCGISRMSFYYHFKDIYDLVEWICEEDGKRILDGKKTYDTWKEGMTQIFEAVLENKSFILNVYSAVSREKIEKYLNKLACSLIANVVEEKSAGTSIDETDKLFMDWIARGMKDDHKEIVERMSITLRGNITNSIRNFELKKKN